MNTHIVEYRAKKNTASKIVDWTVLDKNVPFKSLRVSTFDLRINGEVFSELTDTTFEEKYNNAMFWLRMSS